jgi:hypothetical protein
LRYCYSKKRKKRRRKKAHPLEQSKEGKECQISPNEEHSKEDTRTDAECSPDSRSTKLTSLKRTQIWDGGWGENESDDKTETGIEHQRKKTELLIRNVVSCVRLCFEEWVISFKNTIRCQRVSSGLEAVYWQKEVI